MAYRPNRLPAKPDAQQARSCIEKKRYSSEQAARVCGTGAAAAFQAPLWIYPCQICRGWHLTSSKRSDVWAVDYYTKEEK